MAWIKFVNTGGSFQPKLSIRNNGQIGLSQGFLNRYDLDGEGWYLVLYYDPEARRIGIERTRDPKAPGAVKLMIRAVPAADGRVSKSAQVSARSFLDFNRINYRDGLRSFRAEDELDGELIVVDLNKELKGPDAEE